jgi:heptose I phosphotransferase
MTLAVTDDFAAKQGRSTGRVVLQHSDEQLAVYLKRHYRLPWLHGLLAVLWPGRGRSPAFQEWNHLQWALSQGLPVPRPLAAGERIGPGCRLQSFLAVQELVGMLPLHRAIPAAAARLDGITFRRWKRGLAEEMAVVARALHRRRRFHKDFYLCHFFIPEEDTFRLPAWPGRVWLIDLHRLGHHPLTAPWWRAKDLGQLLFSSEIPEVDASDRLHFWRAYISTSRQSWLAQVLKWVVCLRAWTYRRHEPRRQRARRSPEISPSRDNAA